MEELKLVALDKDDIEIVSAHVQDALVKVADILWQPREQRFVMALNRFRLDASVPLASEDSQIGVRMRVCLYGQDRTHPGSS